MLGQLLHSLNPARRAPTLESDTENLHTKDLLFPSSHVDGAHANDCMGDLDLECPRDVRVLVAQGEALSLQSILLFDSKLSTTPESPRPRHTRTASRSEVISHHTRTASGPPRQYGRQPNIEPIPENSGRDTPALAGGSFTPSHQRTRSRRASVPIAPNSDENTPVRQKESDEVVKIALECMFENTPTVYRGIGNKIHIVPLDSRSSENGNTALTGNSSQPSSARGSVVRRPSTLSSSYTPSDPLPQSPRLDSAVHDQPQVDNRRRTVLITRTFSVNWSEEDNQTPNDPVAAIPNHNHGGLSSPTRPVRQTKKQAVKPPMYAITLILHLPIANRDVSPPPSRSGPGMHRKGSHTSHSSVGSSFDSKNNAGWVMSDAVFSFDSCAISSDVDDRVDLIGQHWDIIVRALTALQTLVEEKILQQLKSMTRKGRDPKLLHLGLAYDNGLRVASDMACSRLIRGIMIPRVRTGQGRWGVWRDEARWLDKWAGGREKNAFFFQFITAFLGTHTEWLNVVGPKTYRRRHREQQRLTSATEDLSIPSRTIIVSTDKMAARRLIFLLAAFLPANHHSRGDASPLRPSTSASFRAYSESPPMRMPLSRHESLRRTINRRGKRSTSRQGAPTLRTAQSSNGIDITDDKTETETIRFAGEDGLASSRHSSESRSALPLTMSDTDVLSRKSSATTSATATPGSTIPIAHIVRKSSTEQHTSSGRPNTGDSIASDNLLSTLQRSTTSPPSGGGPQPLSRWGSLRSLWSGTTRRESSSAYSDNDEGLGIAGLRHSDRLHGKLQQMVNEAEIERARSVSPHRNSVPPSPEMPSITPEVHTSSLEDQSPTKSMPIDVPLKMTVNEQDGVIDVELPFPGWGSPLQSPPAVGSHSGSSFGSTEPPSLMSYGVREADHPMNVAGMLGRLHPDFELQAVPSYPELFDHIKNAMLMEPNPMTQRTFTNAEPVEEWIDVCTSLITDTSTYTIKRLRLRRLVRFLPPPSQPPSAPGPSFLKSQYGNPYSNAQLASKPTEITLEEKFEETKVTDMDSDLVFAIERVLSQSGTSSKAPSKIGRAHV